MASLKEVKGRILSANNTLKITSAMKMVASAKLHKAQEVIEGMLPYERQMSAIMTHFLQTGGKAESTGPLPRNGRQSALHWSYSRPTAVCAADSTPTSYALTISGWTNTHKWQRKILSSIP